MSTVKQDKKNKKFPQCRDAGNEGFCEADEDLEDEMREAVVGKRQPSARGGEKRENNRHGAS